MNQCDFDNFLYKLESQRDGLIEQFKEKIELFKMLLNESILEMSQAFIEDKKAVVTKGPLIYYQDHIVKVDKHNKLACLDLKFMNRQILVGLNIKSKI